MDCIVLVKLVADIENIPSDAWDVETGTLRRGRLHMVANPLDDRALLAARRLADAGGGRVVALSMGPRSAEAACRRALAYGAHASVLLSDAAFAGADTLATARVLAAAIRRATREHGLTDPLILAGMQSPDGDTAQVPAAVAALLDLPLLPYATALDYVAASEHATGLAPAEDGIRVELLRERGSVRATVAAVPAVVTFTGLAPSLPFATSLRCMAGAARARVPRWGARKLGLDPSLTGLAGSATRVVDIRTVSHGHEARRRLNLSEVPDPERAVRDLLREVSAEFSSPSTGAPDAGAFDGESVREEVTGAGRPAIWAWIEPGHTAGLELLGEARRLADQLGADVVAVIASGQEAGTECGELARPTADGETAGDSPAVLLAHGATRILRLHAVDADGPDAGERPAREDPRAELLAHHRNALLLAAAAAELRPRTILIPATLQGRMLSALAAAHLGAGLTADCTSLALEEGDSAEGRSAEDGGSPVDRAMLQIRPALGGNVLATIVSTVRERGLPEMATVRSGVFPLRTYPVAQSREAEDVRLRVAKRPTDFVRQAAWRTRPPHGDRRGVDPDAEIVVAVGAGIGGPERLEGLVLPLREALEAHLGTPVSLACSRAVVDAGILPYEYQIGQTGKSVRPKLYLALGISGAIQHRLGMEHSARVLAINPDEGAPIHAISDYPVVATIEQAVPLIIRAATG